MANPTDLTFDPIAFASYFDPQPTNLIDGTEPFTSDTGQFSLYTEGSAGVFAVSGGEGVITHVGAGSNRSTIVTVTAATLDMPHSFVSIDVTSIPTGSASVDRCEVGLVKDGGNFVFASIDRVAQSARILIVTGGGFAFKGIVTGQSWLTAPFKLGFSLVGNSACLWKDVGGGWQFVTGATITEYDFKTVGNLAGWKAGFMVATQNAAEWHFDNLKWGRFGGVGMRDQVVASEENGSTYVDGSYVYFSASLPDPRGRSTCGVFRMDMTSHTYEQVGVIMVERDGKVQNDLNAHLIVYGNGDRRVVMSTWGHWDEGGNDVAVEHKLETSLELLSGSHVVSGMSDLSLPGLLSGSYGAYDPMLAYDSANSRWLVAYTITTSSAFTNIYPALAESTDLSGWSLIGADTAVGSGGWEGTKLALFDGAYWVMTGGPIATGDSSRVYDVSMSFIGSLDATFEGGIVGSVGVIPHPALFAFGGNFFILSFDDTSFQSTAFTWGQPKLQGTASTSPVLSCSSATTDSITVGIVAGAGATDHAVYAAKDDENFTPSAGNLIDGSIGADPGTYTLLSTGAGERWTIVVRGTDGVVTSDARITCLSTGGGVAPAFLSTSPTGTTTARLATDDPAGSTASRFQYRLASDPDWSGAVEVIVSGTAHYILDISGLTLGVQYIARVRHDYGGVQGPWSSERSWVQTWTPPPPVAIGKFTAPLPGTRVEDTYQVAWNLGGSWQPTELALSVDNATWTPLATSGLTGPAGTYDWDTTAHADGPTVLRMTASDAHGNTARVYTIAIIDNADFYGTCGNGQGAPLTATDWANTLVTGGWYRAVDPGGPWDGIPVATTNGATIILPCVQQGVRAFSAIASGAVLAVINPASPTPSWWMNLHIDGGGFAIEHVSPSGVVNAALSLRFPFVTVWGGCANQVNSLRGIGQFSMLAVVNRTLQSIGSGTTTGGGGDSTLTVQGSFLGCSPVELLTWHHIGWVMERPDAVGNPKRYNFTFWAFAAQGSFQYRTGTIDIEDGSDPGEDGLPCGFVQIRAYQSNFLPSIVPILGGGLGVEEDCDDIPPGTEPEDFPTTVEVICDCFTIIPDPLIIQLASAIRYQVAADTGSAGVDWDNDSLIDTGFRSVTDPATESYALDCTLPAGFYVARYIIQHSGGSEQASTPAVFEIPVIATVEPPLIISPFNGEVVDDGDFVLEFDVAPGATEYAAFLSKDDGLTRIEIAPRGTIDPNTPYDIDVASLGIGAAQVIVVAYGPCGQAEDYVCIELETPCPPVEVDPTVIRRGEVWSDTPFNGGIRTGFVPERIQEVDDRETNMAREELSLAIPRWSELTTTAGVWNRLGPRKVFRSVYDDFSWDEWRVATQRTEHRGDGSTVVHLKKTAIWYDLSYQMVVHYLGNGTAEMDFVLARTPLEHLQFILRSGRRRYFRAGDVVPTQVVEVQYSRDTQRSAIDKLMQTLPGWEIEVERTCAYYQVNIVADSSAGHTGPTADFDYEILEPAS